MRRRHPLPPPKARHPLERSIRPRYPPTKSSSDSPRAKPSSRPSAITLPIRKRFIIQTLDSGGRPDGEYRMTSEVVFTPAGKRYERVVSAPSPTLERITLSQQDLDDLEHVQPFVLTTNELSKYDVKYVDHVRLDELGTYVFEVGPKTLEKNQRYLGARLGGRQDFEIVKTDGKAVPDIRKKGPGTFAPSTSRGRPRRTYRRSASSRTRSCKDLSQRWPPRRSRNSPDTVAISGVGHVDMRRSISLWNDVYRAPAASFVAATGSIVLRRRSPHSTRTQR